MAAPPPGAMPGQPSPQQIAAMQQMQQQMQQQFAAEAARRGLTPEQFAQQQREQLNAEAQKHGMTTEQYVTQLRMRAMAAQRQQVEAQRRAQASPQPGQPGLPSSPQQQPQQLPQPQTQQQPQQPSSEQQQQQQQQQQPLQPKPQMQQTTHQVPVNPSNPPDPKAIAVAKFLRSQNLKSRTCIMDGQRKDMFKVKRAIRALESPAYAKAAAKKNSLLPPVTDRASAENVFKLLPLSLLALRVSKVDPHAGHNHAAPQKRVKGLWTVKIEQHQETDPMMHYVFLYEGPQWKQKAMAVGVVAAIFAVVLFPLWPIFMRQGVWYLSVGMMGLLGVFFAMSIFRLILFCVTVFVVPPGLWLFPNLFEDVGFLDSFKPLWGWQESKKKKKSKKSSEDTPKSTSSTAKESTPSATTTATPAADNSVVKRDLKPRVEEVTEE